ncbi:MAG: bifunctional folylpolyglutamate synthase/dihydrofolate synthase [Ruminococcaceae bacterium]|nr:bifunctional folylpolyglutamate synthase/dihydrofolate synthase [Oscillospiraceae bacterium]
MNYQEAMQYIHSISWSGSRPGLERIGELCEKMHHPEDSLNCIHVAGTNGKGSFCCMLSNVLTAAGYKTGLFTSPYIETFNERMQIDGQNIGNDELAEITAYVKQFADTMEDPPTEFELITAVAFEYFRRNACDYIVLEAGLGGRLDSTNIIQKATLSVITGIDLDHTAILGDTPAAIAREKAGIIKPDTPLLFGEGCPEAEAVIHETCTRIAGEKAWHQTDYTRINNVKTSLYGTEFNFGTWENIKMHLLGLYQLKNCANVLTAVEILRENGCDISDESVYTGIAAARWKARFEKLSETPLILYDGAHNPQGITAAAENIRRYLIDAGITDQIVLTMGVLRDKDYPAMIAALAPLCASVVTITPPNPRALPAEETAAEFTSCGVAAEPAETLAEGVKTAYTLAQKKNKPLVILGSLYIYGEVKEALADLLH